jgi:pimeloyl-ACP methyl ester carboxylesterase
MWQAGAAETAALMAQCLRKLAPDHDVAQYTTSVAVADLEDIRQRLGLRRLNLYGSSYGTRVAQHYARRFPDRTRALILDGDGRLVALGSAGRVTSITPVTKRSWCWFWRSR